MKTVINLLNKFIPKKDIIIFHSFTDCSDNSLAMYLHLKKHKSILKRKYKFVWLVDDISKKKKYIKLIENYGVNECTLDTSFIKRKSFKGILKFLQAKYIFCTHGINSFIKTNSNQVIVNLWHGMPLKKIGYLDGKEDKKVYKSDFLISTSIFFQKIMESAFKSNNVLISGQPRNDLLIGDDELSKLEYKNIVWLPTYRKSKIGDIRSDGNENNLTKEILSKDNLTKINTFLLDKKIKLKIKLHPMDSLNLERIEFDNIEILSNDDLEEKGINLYTILKDSVALITDYSSVYVDYLLLNRPIAFLIDDINEYDNSRGFVVENINEYMPGKKLENINDFYDFINDIFSENDEFKNERKNVNLIFNELRDNKNCERLCRKIGLY